MEKFAPGRKTPSLFFCFAFVFWAKNARVCFSVVTVQGEKPLFFETGAMGEETTQRTPDQIRSPRIVTFCIPAKR
jgi:hypothetical protein